MPELDNLLIFPSDPETYQSLLVASRAKYRATPSESSKESVEGRLLAAARQYISDTRIFCAESIYQTDRVAETSIEFVEEVCNIVGYLDPEAIA